MNTVNSVVVLMGALCLVGCENITINFDELPDGTPLQGWDGSPGGLPSEVIISNEYESMGVSRFSSGGDGVFLLPLGNAPSAPNVACPFAAGGLLDYGETTTIELTEDTCNIWVSFPVDTNPVTVTVYDSGGNYLGAESSTGPNASVVEGGGVRVNVNYCGIRRVDISGSNYCFDDFTWQRDTN